jgi:hypothetical protein
LVRPHRRTAARENCPARCHDRLGGRVRPTREQQGQGNRGAGGRRHFDWWRVYNALAERGSSGNSQPHRPAKSINRHADSNGRANANCDSHADTSGNSYTRANSRTDTNSNTLGYAGTYADGNGYSGSKRNRYRDSDGCAQRDTISHFDRHRHGHANSYCYCDSQRYSHGRSYSHPFSYANGDRNGFTLAHTDSNVRASHQPLDTNASSDWR